MKLTVTTRISCTLLALAWPTLHAFAAGAPGFVEGRLTQVTTSSIQLDHDRTYQFNPAVARCFDFRGDAMSCDTLVGIANKFGISTIGEMKRLDLRHIVRAMDLSGQCGSPMRA